MTAITAIPLLVCGKCSLRVTKFVPDDTLHCVKSLISVAGLHQSGIAFSETTRTYSSCARIFGYAVLIFAAFLLCTASLAQSQNAPSKPRQKSPSPKASPTPEPQSAGSDQPVPDLSPAFLRPSAEEQKKQLSDIATPLKVNGSGIGSGIGSREPTVLAAAGRSPFCKNGHDDLCFNVAPPFVTAPRALFAPEPDYTEAARKARLEGMAVFKVIIGVDGKVYDPKLLKSLSPDLDAQAIAAMKQWKFQPATLNGQPVAVFIKIEVNFQLYERPD
jgi:TonB family protein